MFINIDGNIINLNELIFIRKDKSLLKIENKPGIQIKLKGDTIINLIYDSDEEANTKLDDIWKSICLQTTLHLK